jgi:hypothetical protein
MKQKCPRCGSVDVQIEKPWPHLHCSECGLRRFGTTFEQETGAKSSSGGAQKHSPPVAGTQSLPAAGPRQRRERVIAFGVLFGVPAVLGFVLGSQFAAAVLVFCLLIYLICFVRGSWQQRYLLYTGLLFAALIGGMARDVIFPPTALCVDGSYSYSAHHSGTCSWHGGVARWRPPPWWQRMLGH